MTPVQTPADLRPITALRFGAAMWVAVYSFWENLAGAGQSGLVAKVVPAADLMTEALKTANEIAAMPPLAAIANKEMVNMAFETTLQAGLIFERRLFNGLCSTEDKSEGMTAFSEKRAGNFTGR